MTSPPDDTTTDTSAIIAELRQELAARDAALAQRNSEYGERIEQQAATIDVLKAMSASPGNPQPVFDLIVRRAQELCNSRASGIFEYDGELVHLRSEYGARDLAGAAAYFAAFPMKPTHGSIACRAILDKQVIHIRDLAAEQELLPIVRNLTIRSNLAIPLLRGGAAIGAFIINSLEPGGFSDSQVALVGTFAEQAVIAITSAETYRALQTRTSDLQQSLEYQTATSDVLKVISRSAFDLQPVLDTLVETAARLCDADMAGIGRREGELVRVVAFHGYPPEYRAWINSLGAMPLDRRIVGHRAALEGRVVHVHDVAAEPNYPTGSITLGKMRTSLGVPLLREGEAVGSIVLARQRVDPFTDRQIGLVSTFADQAVIAIENTRLITEQREALEQQTATAEVLGVINASPGVLAPVFDAILEKAHHLCGAVHGVFGTYNGDYFRAVASRGLPAAVLERLKHGFHGLENPITRPLFDGARFVQIPDLKEIDHPMPRAVSALGGFRTALFVPLRKDGTLLGHITALRSEARPFTDKQIALLQNFAAQAVIAIENARLITEQREALEQQTATAEVLQVINASPGELAPVFDALLEKARRLCEAAIGFLWTWDGEAVHRLAFQGIPVELMESLRQPFKPKPGSIPERIIAGENVVSEADLLEMPDAPHRWPVLTRLLARSFVGVALRKDDILLGGITIYRQEPRPFTDKQIALLQNFAAQAVIAMDNARLLTEQREALEQQTATADVLQVINANPGNLTPVFDAILEKAHRLCGARVGALGTFDGTNFRALATYGYPEQAEAVIRQPYPREPHHEPLFRGETSHVRDVKTHPWTPELESMRIYLEKAGLNTMLAVPLHKDGVLLGFISAASYDVRPFSEKEIKLLENFAAQAVIAMENARLLTEQQEALEQQTATAEVLQVINASPGNLAPVFEAILEKAHDLCDIAHGDLQLYDGEHLHSVAQRGLSAEFADRLRQGYRASDSPASRPLLAGDRFTHITDASAVDFMVFRSSIRPHGIRTVLFVPLRKEGSLLGMITSARREVRPFTEKEIALLENFAAQAVIAMENARLLDELRERTEALAQRNSEFGERIEQQSATIDVLKVMSSTPDDTQPVFELIVRRAQELCKGVGASLIELEGNLVHFRATHSPASHSNDPAAVEAWKALFPMVPTLEWLSCRAILEKREVHIRDVQTDPGLSDVVRATNSDIRSHLTVPLMRDGQAIGSISLRGKEPGGFTDSQVALLRTFAEQAVIAIGSVANFRALRERTAELAQRQEELRVTFENMGDGVAMFDETQHLVAWNRKFQDILDVPDDIIARRQTFSEYVRYLAERGEYGPEADPEEHVRGLIERAGQSRTYERTRPDGRVIEIRSNPVADGGFVLIYADITERKRSEAEIRAARDAAEEASRTIEAAYRELKTAQANLIQAEKMASLGQLTAGIAHEIKNPLNFVNNFSALSTELIDELRDVLAPEPLGETARTEVDDLTALLKGNLEKVVQHGQRADGIVRSMLDHSRGSSGERRMVDLNTVIDEALNLAYHGARAQDQSFNITLERDFGEGISPIEVNPQDITRVFLNLFSNGFYATTKRARDGGDAGFMPTLKVTTIDAGEAVEIRVRDNGTGIPTDIRDKLFQPFFTTKPTGEGTGLGLSITYDIVTQQHGGNIAVDSKVGEYSEFTIQLPRNP